VHTFVDPLDRALRTASDQTAVVCGDRRWTYREHGQRIRRLIGGLGELGLERGDRVAILAPNSDAYLELYTGAPAGGYAIVPMNTRHAQPELEYALADSGARVLFTDRDPGSLGDIVDRVIPLGAGPLGDGYEELLAGAPEGELDRTSTPDTIAGLFYTGGTTGASKGVILSHGNLIANAWHMLVAAQLAPDDIYLVQAPLFHAAGSLAVLASVWLGSVQVVAPAFDPGEVLDLIEREGVTATLGVPTMVAALAETNAAAPRDTSKLRMLMYGGSPSTTEVLRRAHEQFPNAELVHLYGATETAPLVTTLRRHETKLDGSLGTSAGQPVVGVECVVRDELDVEVEPGHVGRVTVRGPNIMAGYWNKPEQTAEVLRDGWYDTGDLGYVDENANLFLVDRAKDMIVSGGENVYSTEVEEALYRHPMVLEATVFGIPNEAWGEAVHAVVVPRAEVSPEELIEHCRALIAGYKVPRSVELRAEELPKSGPGKVLKRELRAPYWEGSDRRI